MPIQWHPILIRLLKREMGDTITIIEELPLGEAPVRVDMVMVCTAPVEQLPSPYCYLKQRTLVEFKGPDDRAVGEDLARLEAYGILYQIQEGIYQRENICLWLAASQFSARYLHSYGTRVEGLRQVEPGIQIGRMDGFWLCILDLQSLSVNRYTLPWLMVTRGRKEREVIEYIVEHHEELHEYIEDIARLHWNALTEVLRMKDIDLEAIGFDFRKFVEDVGIDRLVKSIGIDRLIESVGIDKLVESVGVDKLIESVGIDKLIESVGIDRLAQSIEISKLIDAVGTEHVLQIVETEKLLDELVRRCGKEQLRRMLDGDVERDE